MSLLDTQRLEAFYGDFQALFGIDLRVDAGQTVAIIGANGSGKSTFLRTITGLLASAPDTVHFDGQAIGGLAAHQIVRRGIAMVPEGRKLFRSLTLEENLLMGACSRRPGPWNLRRVYGLFPNLERRRAALGNRLSGGEQQMVAIGRALMCNPRLLLCDELSLGLAPIVIKGIYATIPTIVGEGTAVVVVEQDINKALAISDRIYCFRKGAVSLEGVPGQLSRQQITQAYFGI